jgi:hypothetical protein
MADETTGLRARRGATAAGIAHLVAAPDHFVGAGTGSTRNSHAVHPDFRRGTDLIRTVLDVSHFESHGQTETENPCDLSQPFEAYLEPPVRSQSELSSDWLSWPWGSSRI